MKKTLPLLLVLTMAAPAALGAQGKPSSCRMSKEQLHAQTLKRYAIDETYSLLTKCGLGDLLNFGLGDLGISLDSVDMCSKPLNYLASIPAREAATGFNRGVNAGLRRPINGSIAKARQTVRSGSWYKDSEVYKGGGGYGR